MPSISSMLKPKFIPNFPLLKINNGIVTMELVCSAIKRYLKLESNFSEDLNTISLKKPTSDNISSSSKSDEELWKSFKSMSIQMEYTSSKANAFVERMEEVSTIHLDFNQFFLFL